MSIYLLRHIETTWNVEKRFQGSKEGELTEDGKSTAHLLAKSSFWKRMNVLYHPENKRTGYISDLLKSNHPNIEIRIDNRLMERSMGKYEGLLYSDFPEKGEFDAGDFEQRYVWQPPNGESHQEVEKRVNDFYQTIKESSKKQNILCITSRGVIKVMLKNMYNLTLEQMYNIKSPPLTLIHLGEKDFYTINPLDK